MGIASFEFAESYTKVSPETAGKRAKDTKDTVAASGTVSFVALGKLHDGWLLALTATGRIAMSGGDSDRANPTLQAQRDMAGADEDVSGG